VGAVFVPPDVAGSSVAAMSNSRTLTSVRVPPKFTPTTLRYVCFRVVGSIVGSMMSWVSKARFHEGWKSSVRPLPELVVNPA